MNDTWARAVAGVARGCAALLASSAIAATISAAVPFAVRPGDSLSFERFGSITLYRPHGTVHHVVLFLSGEDGWTSGVSALAQHLAERGSLVAGIDLRHYAAQVERASAACASPSSDLENLSHYVQSSLGLKSYTRPTLAGYSAGASFVYATLVESPEGLFTGGLSIGFNPTLNLKKPICQVTATEGTAHLEGGVLKSVTLLPHKLSSGKWVAVQGEGDLASPASMVKKFVAAVPGAEFFPVAKMVHDVGEEKSWAAPVDVAFSHAAALGADLKSGPLPAVLADLPLHIVPAAAGGSSDWFAVFLTGDGGWVALDQGVSAELARHNIPIVGWDSLKYFWSRRTPEGAARDLDRVLRFYAHAWRKAHVLLIGYSQGADTMPFMVNRLPPATRGLVGFTTLLGISDNAVWEFHLTNWLGTPARGSPTAPELERWSGSPYLCLYGENDPDSACEQLTGHDGSALKMAGSHHFAGAYSTIAEQILSRLPAL